MNRSFVLTLVLLLLLLLLSVGCNGKVMSPTTPSMTVVGEWDSEGVIYCGVYSDSKSKNLFVVTTGERDRFGHALLRVLSVDDPVRPQEIASLELPIAITPLAPPIDLALVEDVLYVPLAGSERSGLWIVDVSNPESPREIRFVDTEPAPSRLALSENLAAVSAMHPGTILFFDISDPKNPQQLGLHARSARSTLSMELVDSVLYAAYASGVCLIDVSTSSPQEVGFVSNPEWKGLPIVSSLSVQTGKATPEGLLDTVVKPDDFLDIALSWPYAYVAASGAGVRIIDVTSPADPVAVGRLEVSDRVRSVVSSGNRIYLLGANSGDGPSLSWSLQTVDISNATNPEIVAGVGGIRGTPPYQSLIPGDGVLYFLNFDTLLVVSIPD